MLDKLSEVSVHNNNAFENCLLKSELFRKSFKY